MGIFDTAYEFRARPEFVTEVAKGNVQGHSVYRKWGRNPDLDIGTEYLWQAGGEYIWQSVADTVNLVSSSDADNGATATGWITCQVFGYNAVFERIDEFITLNGLTPVSTINEYLFIYRINAADGDSVVGSDEVNAGNITATFDGTGDIANVVASGDGSTMSLLDIVPAAHTLLITGYSFSSFRTTAGQVPRLVVQAITHPDGYGKTLIREDVLDTSVLNHVNIFIPIDFVATEKTRLWTEVTTDQNNTRISANIQGILIDNNYLAGAIKHF